MDSNKSKKINLREVIVSISASLYMVLEDFTIYKNSTLFLEWPNKVLGQFFPHTPWGENFSTSKFVGNKTLNQHFNVCYFHASVIKTYVENTFSMESPWRRKSNWWFAADRAPRGWALKSVHHRIPRRLSICPPCYSQKAIAWFDLGTYASQ